MNPADIIALVGLIFVGCGALGGTAWKIVQYVNSQIKEQSDKVDLEIRGVRADVKEVDDKRSSNNRELHVKIDHAVESLDIKFNIIRESIDKIKDNMVRRDDLDDHIARIERGIEATGFSIEKLREQVVDILTKRAAA